MMAAQKRQDLETSRNQSREVIRQCVVCRQRADSSKMVRMLVTGEKTGCAGVPRLFFARGDDGRARRLGVGHSAYVCVSRRCIAALDERVMRRVFRGARVERDDSRPVHEQLEGMALKGLAQSLGLARRMGAVTFGVDRIVQRGNAARRNRVIIVAMDLSDRSVRALGSVSRVNGLSSAELGRFVGMGSVGALAVDSGPQLRVARYWLMLLDAVANDGDLLDRRCGLGASCLPGADVAKLTEGR